MPCTHVLMYKSVCIHGMDGMHVCIYSSYGACVHSISHMLCWFEFNSFGCAVLLFSCMLHPFEHTMDYFSFCCCLSQSSYIFANIVCGFSTIRLLRMCSSYSRWYSAVPCILRSNLKTFDV